MKASPDTKKKFAELSKLLDQAQKAESKAVMKSGPYGNDLVDLYNKIKELLASIGIGDLTGDGIHIALHFAIDWLTKIAPTLTMWQRFAVLAIIKVLEAVDKRWHPEPTA